MSGFFWKHANLHAIDMFDFEVFILLESFNTCPLPFAVLQSQYSVHHNVV